MITVRECKYEDRKRYNELEGEYHYMGESHGAYNRSEAAEHKPSVQEFF